MVAARTAVGAALLVLAGCMSNNEWQSVSDRAVAATLVNRTVVYTAGEDEGARQTWFADGTMDWRGQQGRWRVQEQQYCSIFDNDAAPEWRCYDYAIASDGTRVRFERGGRVWVASFVN